MLAYLGAHRLAFQLAQSSPTDWSGTAWIVASTSATAVFTALMVAIMWWQYQQSRRIAGEAKPIRLSAAKDGFGGYEPAMAGWDSNMSAPDLRSLHRVSAFIANRSGVPQHINVTCKIVWPRRPHLRQIDDIKFTMQSHDGGNFDVRFAEFSWFGLSEDEIEERRKAASRDQARYIIRLRAETVSGKQEACWLYTRLPIYGDFILKEFAKSDDQAYTKDAAIAAMIDEANELLSGNVDDLEHREEVWHLNCGYEILKYFGPSKRSSFRVECARGNTSRARISAGLEFLKGLA